MSSGTTPSAPATSSGVYTGAAGRPDDVVVGKSAVISRSPASCRQRSNVSRSRRATSTRPRKVEQRAGVQLADHRRFVVGDVDQCLFEHLATVGPVGVVVRGVTLPHHAIDTDLVAIVERRLIADEARPEVAANELGRGNRAVDFEARTLPRVVHSLD